MFIDGMILTDSGVIKTQNNLPVILDGVRLSDGSTIANISGGSVRIDGIELTAGTTLASSGGGAVKIDGIELPATKTLAMADASPVLIDGIKVPESKSIQINIPYDIGSTMLSAATVDTIVTRFVAVRSFVIPANFAGSRANASKVAASVATFVLKRNESTVGSFSFAVGSAVAVFGSCAATTFSAGDTVTLTATVVDSTMDNMNYTLAGSIVDSVQ